MSEPREIKISYKYKYTQEVSCVLTVYLTNTLLSIGILGISAKANLSRKSPLDLFYDPLEPFD